MKFIFEYLGNEFVCRFTMSSMIAALKKLNMNFENIGEATNFLSFLLAYIEFSLPSSIKNRELFVEDLQCEAPQLFKDLINTAKESMKNNVNFFSENEEALQIQSEAPQV